MLCWQGRAVFPDLDTRKVGDVDPGVTNYIIETGIYWAKVDYENITSFNYQ